MSEDNRGIEPYTDVDIEIQGYGSQSEPAPELEGRNDVPADPYLGRSQWAIKEYTVDGSSEE
ncbi:hypothetical protein SD71_02510 [Cohnella kolymensis]|uniref:Transposase n=1 Tax=Cohnella kolymensis TaxID=1590652 RepID=A0ABR5A9C5_9BACL|nr:hypothetical protein [Cohnella kolymensis]KIL37522.1 hypothetical protein SD71_02510 [Cohnella kolymensis]